VLEGIGSSCIYYPLSQAKLDGALIVSDTLAIEMAHYLLKYEGLFVGPSAGINVVGALWIAKKLGPGHTIVTVLCDSGNSYKSKAFDPNWLKEHNISLNITKVSSFLEAFDELKHITVLRKGI